jgi:hypothetical protein
VNTIIGPAAPEALGSECEISDATVTFEYDIDSGGSCGFGTADHSLSDTNPLLEELADNGGPTETMALQPGSPAIDAADSSACPATDQRGVSRPQGAGCDIGAVEAEAEEGGGGGGGEEPPAAITGGTYAVGAAGATLLGIVEPKGEDASYWFEYGTSTAYEHRTASADAGLIGPFAAAAGLSGLEPETTYHYRIVAEHLGEAPVHGVDRTFTTAAQSGPSATTGAATEVSTSSAVLNGVVNPHGDDTQYRFEYGTSTTYGEQSAEQPAGTGSDDQAVQTTLSSLQPNTTYDFRVVASGTQATSFGANASFTTPPLPPTATTTAVTAIGVGEATLTGEVGPMGQDTSYHFEYVDEAQYQEGGFADATSAPRTEASAGDGGSSESVSQQITGLSAGTTYHVRLAASNHSGTAVGEPVTFDSATPAPTVVVEGIVANGTTVEVHATVDLHGESGSYSVSAPYSARSCELTGGGAFGEPARVWSTTGSARTALPAHNGPQRVTATLSVPGGAEISGFTVEATNADGVSSSAPGGGLDVGGSPAFGAKPVTLPAQEVGATSATLEGETSVLALAGGSSYWNVGLILQSQHEEGPALSPTACSEHVQTKDTELEPGRTYTVTFGYTYFFQGGGGPQECYTSEGNFYGNGREIYCYELASTDAAGNSVTFTTTTVSGSGKGNVSRGGGTITAPIACVVRYECDGSSVLELSKHSADAAAVKGKKAAEVLVLAKGRIKLRPHRHGTLRMHATKAGRRLLAHIRTLTVTQVLVMKRPHGKPIVTSHRMRLRRR